MSGMMKLMKCGSCERYTLEEECPECGSSTKNPSPPPFSPEDKYGKYRRSAKLKADKEI